MWAAALKADWLRRRAHADRDRPAAAAVVRPCRAVVMRCRRRRFACSRSSPIAASCTANGDEGQQVPAAAALLQRLGPPRGRHRRMRAVPARRGHTSEHITSHGEREPLSADRPTPSSVLQRPRQRSRSSRSQVLLVQTPPKYVRGFVTMPRSCSSTRRACAAHYVILRRSATRMESPRPLPSWRRQGVPTPRHPFPPGPSRCRRRSIRARISARSRSYRRTRCSSSS